VLGLSYFRQIVAVRASARRNLESSVVLGFILALTLPCLVYRYLPMVDLPQHEAVVSMMLHLPEPGFGFNTYYAWAPTRTLYLFPYGLAAALAQIMPLHRALNVVVFLATLSYPVGVVLCLRALKRPSYIALIALPVVYNQSFFWGFLNFNLSLGLAFVTISLMLGEWSTRKRMGVAILACTVALTHIYGLLLLGIYLGLWLLTSERAQAQRRIAALIPAALLLVLWVVLLAKAKGFAEFDWTGVSARWSRLPDSIAGGWRGRTETLSLLFAAAIIIAFFNRSLPWTLTCWKRLGVQQRLAWQFISINLLLYFIMPELPQAATKSSFRHAQIAVMALPLTLVSDAALAIANWVRPALWLLGAFCVLASWSHFGRFDAEARSFDAVVDAIPRGARVAQLTYERQGRVANVPVYMHFAAYAQAQKGGLLAVSFPSRFWNMPVARKANFALPPIPKGLEWNPQLFGAARLDRCFDYIVLRAARTRTPGLPVPFPYQLQLKSGPWWLLRKVESRHD